MGMGEGSGRHDGPHDGPSGDGERRGSLLRRHPVISATAIALTLAGAVAGGLYLDPEWSLARRILAGAFAGAGTAILITATKMIG